MTMNSDGSQDSQPVMAKLKQVAWRRHAALGTLPFFKALMAQQLPLDCYVRQLRVLSIIYGALEHGLASSEDEPVRQVWREDMRKLPLLQEDLAFLDTRGIADAGGAVEAAEGIAYAVRLLGVSEPHALLGCLYVFEGTTLGNSMHHPDVLKTFRFAGADGSRFYNSYGAAVREHWRAFSERMNRALQDPSCHPPLLDAASDMLTRLAPVYTGLYPIDDASLTRHVTGVNPEAGNHPMPQDQREIDAALRASGRGWDAFPYYTYRYGERGKRFSDSDCCWLATLAALDPDDLQRQVDWLVRVLASRGMPSVMLERTLELLADELTAALPERASDYAKLGAAAAALRLRRERLLADVDVRSLCGTFEQSLGPELAGQYPDAGALLAAAAADTAGGCEEALPSLCAFLMDASRFPERWVRAVGALSHSLKGAVCSAAGVSPTAPGDSGSA